MNPILCEQNLVSGQKIQIAQGDISTESLDAIVNAANSHLKHGGGVAGVISRKGGAVIQRESNQWVRDHGPVSHTDPAYTSGSLLPCKYIIHAVGPIWGSGDEDNKLGQAITGSLKVADQLKLESIAFPAISTGIFGFPKERAAKIILESLHEYFKTNPQSGIKIARLTLFDDPTVEVFLEVWDVFSKKEAWGL